MMFLHGNRWKVRWIRICIMLLATLGTIIYAHILIFRQGYWPKYLCIFCGCDYCTANGIHFFDHIYFTKGYYMEEQDFTKKEELKECIIYLFDNFQVGAIVLLWIIGAFFFILYSNIILIFIYSVNFIFLLF